MVVAGPETRPLKWRGSETRPSKLAALGHAWTRPLRVVGPETRPIKVAGLRSPAHSMWQDKKREVSRTVTDM